MLEWLSSSDEEAGWDGSVALEQFCVTGAVNTRSFPTVFWDEKGIQMMDRPKADSNGRAMWCQIFWCRDVAPCAPPRDVAAASDVPGPCPTLYLCSVGNTFARSSPPLETLTRVLRCVRSREMRCPPLRLRTSAPNSPRARLELASNVPVGQVFDDS
jgi:hypothetical protein